VIKKLPFVATLPLTSRRLRYFVSAMLYWYTDRLSRVSWEIWTFRKHEWKEPDYCWTMPVPTVSTLSHTVLFIHPCPACRARHDSVLNAWQVNQSEQAQKMPLVALYAAMSPASPVTQYVWIERQTSGRTHTHTHTPKPTICHLGYTPKNIHTHTRTRHYEAAVYNPEQLAISGIKQRKDEHTKKGHR
jgi:hypothetical protein